VKEVGRELGVRYVLEGSMRKAANRVRIDAQLIDSITGAHISADRSEGELTDVFDLQDRVASSVAGAIAPKLEQLEIERARRKPTQNLDAYDYFLQALASIYKWTRDSNEKAVRLLYKAIELDASFAAAYAQATWYYCARKNSGLVIDVEHEITETRRLARCALELGKDDAFALCWAGFSLAYILGELDEGSAFLDRSLELNPNLARAWSLSAWVKLFLGDPEKAIEYQARAMRLSPLDPMLHAMKHGTASAHFFAGRYDDALSWEEKALRENPNNVEAVAMLAASCALAGHMEKAQKAMALCRQLAPERRLSNLRARLPPYRSAEIYARLLEALRKAGMPE
jgi:adenylate cyclase